MNHEQQRALRRLVHRHVLACAEEAKRDLRHIADTPGGAAMVAVFEMLRQTAWSLGSTLAANSTPAEPLRSEALAEIAIQIDDGYAHPGEGVML